MSKNMAKLRKPPCLIDDLTFEVYSTDTEDELDCNNMTFNVEDNDKYASTPRCCKPRGSDSFTVIDRTITLAPGIPTNNTYTASYSPDRKSALPGDEESSDVERDYIDLERWKTFQIPNEIEVKNIPPKGRRKVKSKVGETFTRSTNPTETENDLHATQNYSKIVSPDPRGETTRNMDFKGNQTVVRAKSRNTETFSYPQATYTRAPVSSENYGASYATQIPSNLRQLNVTHRVHKSSPTTEHPHPSRTVPTNEDKQPIVYRKEATEYRKKAPRYYSTPEKEDFLNEGNDLSSVWGQDLDSFKSAETSEVEDSSLGWSQGVRMDSFNIIKYMTPSPKNVKVAPRLMKSHPHLSAPSNKMDPNLTGYSQVVFPDSIGETTRNYDFQEGGSPIRTKVSCNATINIPHKNDITVNYPPKGYSQSQNKTFRTTDATFNTAPHITNLPMSPANVTHQMPARSRVTFDQNQNTYSHPAASIPTSQYPQSSRTFSTHGDQQSIPHPREVTEHSKKAPRYYSTPEREDFSNEGYAGSSVWGQDLSSFKSAETSDVEDSSAGWSQGVRMDSFNIIKYMTPSPQNVRGPSRLTQSYPPETIRQNPYIPQYESSNVSSELPEETASLTYSEEKLEEPQVTSTQKQNSTAAEATFNTTRNLTDMVEDTPSSSDQSIPRTNVPRPSRNYMTYVDSEK